MSYRDLAWDGYDSNETRQWDYKKEGKHMKTQRKRLAAVLLSATLTLSNLAGILPQSSVLAAEESVQTEMTQAESGSSEAQQASAPAEAAQPAPAPAEASQPAPAPAEAAQPAPAPAEEPAAAAPAESVSTPEPAAAAETPAAPQQESAAPAESQSAQHSAESQQSPSTGKPTEKEGQTAGKAEAVTVYYRAAEGGSVSSASEIVQASSGAQAAGSEAKAAEGFVFKNWTAADGTVVSTSAFFAPQIPSTTNGGSYTYTAHFEKVAEAPATKMVTVEYVAGNGGTVDRNSETVDVLSADAALLGSTATAQEGYQFVDWTTSGDSIVSSNASFVPDLSADMPEKTVYIANFKKADTMPAQDFEGSVSGVQVNVHADEGRFPEGTTMHLAPVSKASILSNDSVQDAVGEDKEVVDAIAVDITFQDKDGKEIEPAGTISVNMSTSRDVSGDSHQVLHIDDNGNASQVTDASAEGASFEASEFSIYVITGIGTTVQDPAVETWNFYGADNSTILSTQSVKNEETIVSPKTPEKDGYIFQGWAYSVESAASGTVDVNAFTTRTADVSTTQTINLYPVFSQKLYVFFVDTYGRVWQTKEGKAGDKIPTSDVTLPLGSEQSVTGWYTDSTLAGEAVAEVTLENSDVTLYPKVESGHYLFFSSGDGASYVAPQFVSANGVTAKPADPARSGYTFAGWSSSPDSATADYTFGGTLTENTTVYAVWRASTNTKYTVIYWTQSVNDKKDAADTQKTYDYEDSITRTGISGQMASPTTSDKNKGYTGFHYNSSKSVSVTINGDGTTILNVYYDRDTLTIDFYTYSWVSWLRWDWTKDETFTGLYGQTLAQNGYTWPSEDDWYNSSKSNRLTFLDAFIFDTLDEFGDTTSISLYRYDSSGSYTINHYKQNLDGSYSDDSPTNSTKTKGGTFYFSNKYNGFTIDSYSTDGMRTWKAASVEGSTDYYPNLYIRYRRNSYPLSFYNYNGTAKTEQVLYEASLSSYESYVPDRPSDLSDEFNFEGWYKDPELTQKFDFNQNMPAGGITLYAKWAEPTYKGTVHLTIDGTGATTGLTIGYGATISKADMPTVVDADDNVVFQGNDKNKVTLPKDVDWIGWATKDGTQYTTFNFATQNYSDITLYPYYVSKTKYTVTYDVNGDRGAVTDSKEYASGAYADIQSGDGVTALEGKAFLYWNTDKDGKGISYYPGDKLLVTDYITLYAVYGDPAKTTSLTYKTNYPEGSGQTDDKEKLQSVNGSETLQNNASFPALTLKEAGFAVPDGYYFTGWNTAADGCGKSVSEGADILADADGTNILYAQWKKKQAVVLKVKGNTESVTYDGEKHSVKGYTTAITVDGTAATSLPGNLQLDETAAKGRAASGTDARTYSIGLVEGDFSITGSDLKKYSVTIQVTDGSLTILPRTVTLTSDSATREYDGTALTAPDVTIGDLGFVRGEVTSVTANGTQTAVGTSKNYPIEIVKGTNYQDSNYEITEEYGTLEVTQSTAPFTITAKGAEKTYDGTALTESGYTVTKPQGFEKFEVTAVVSGTITDAGTKTKDNIVESYTIKDPSGEDVTGNFTKVTTEKGTLKVNPRRVTLSSQSKSKEYDGTALTAPEVTISGDGFVAGEVGQDSIKATGSITKVGSVANTIAYTTTSAFKESNYNITKKEGTLTIRKNATLITVKSADDSKTYDGTPLTNHTITTTGLPEGFTLTAEVTGSITDVDPNSPSGNNTVENAVIKDKDGNVVTDQFSNITCQAGTLSIEPRKVTLVSKSDSKPYDGTALTAPDVTVGGHGFVAGEVTDIKATGTITEKGSVENTITYTKQAAYKDSNYIVTEKTGTLTIVPANVELVITAPSGSWEYDGNTHSTGNTVTATWSPDENGSKYMVSATVSGSVKNVADGTVDNVIDKSSIKITEKSTGKDVTSNFDPDKITTEKGTLQVTPRYVELTSSSAEKQYDGTALTAPVVTVGEKNFVDGEVSNLKATGSVLTTDEGEVINTIEWKEGKNYDSGNYTIDKHEGKLKITQNQADITVTAESATKVYDGTALTNSAAKVSGLPKGFTATVTVDGSAKNVADTKTGNNKVTEVNITKDGKDVTNQFANITKKDGTLTITKRPVTLKSESGSKPYDGTALELPEVKVTGDGFVDGEIAEGSIKATGSITKVGSVPNSITYKPTLLGNFDENNYKITKEVGILSISKVEIAFRVTANSHTWTYDGKTNTDSGYTVIIPDNDKEIYGKFTVEADVEGSVTNVTKVPVENKITKVTVKLNGEDVTDQFDTGKMTLEDGELQISPVKLTLTSDTGSKEYDGTPLELPKVKVEGSIITTNDKAQITNIRATGSVTGVTTDPVPNTISYETSEDFIRDNYVIIMEEGTLTVTKNTKTEIVFTAKDAAKTYDGTPLTEPGVEVTGLPDGFTGQAEAGGSITNVAQTVEGNNPVTSYEILDKDGKDVKDWFTNVTTKAGTLTITPREITLTSADAKKPYDGTPLEKKEVTVTGAHGLVDTHTIEYTYTGSQTYVGSSPNTFTYLIKDKDGNEIPVSPVSKVTPAPKKSFRAASQDSVKKGNYIITVVYGTLTVTDDVNPEKVVTKTHEGKAYQLGEQIVFEIRVTNIYDTAQTITLTEQDGVVFTGPDTFTDVQPGKIVTTSAYHVVNEEDLANGSYTNTVQAAFKEVGKNWEGKDKEDQFAHLTLAKEVTNTPANGAAYVNGETINYRITVTNDGTAKLYNLNITDLLTEDEWNNRQALAPGEKLTFDTAYKVTDQDTEDGFVTNQAAGNAQDANGNIVKPEPASVRVPVQKAKPSLYLEKTSDKDKAVELGETIHYIIRVVNNGNTVVSDIVVKDEMTGDSWDAGTLKPGEDKSFHTEYVVTEKDILAGSVKNVALADGKDPNGDKPNVTPGEIENKTVPENSHLTVTKKTVSSPKNHSGYAVGETIRYQIEAFNDGNLTLTDVEVTDPLTGDTWKVEKLAPGEKQTFETKYKVTEKDQSAGKVVNKATAKGKTPGSTKLVVVPGATSDPVLPKANDVVTTSNAVPTGDPTQTGAYLAMLLVAAAGIVLLSRKKKEEHR